MCSGSSTTTTNVPEMTDAEKRMMQIYQEAILPQMLLEAGFELKETTVKSEGFSDADYKELQELGNKGMDAEGYPLDLNPEDQKRMEELMKKRSEQGRGGEETTEYELIETEAGKEKRELDETISKQFKENSLKFLSGDFSITDAQRDSIKDVMAPTKAAVEKMYDNMSSELEAGEDFITSMENQFNKYQKGLDKVNRELFQRGIEDYGNEMSTKIMSQAVASGRDPADPEFVNQISSNIANIAAKGGLQLQRDQLMRRERQESRLLDERRGLQQQRLGLAESQGRAGIGMAESAKNLRMQSLGGPGMASSQLVDAIGQQRIANLQGTGGGFMQAGNQMAQERYARTTQTTTSKESPMSIALGVGQMGASIYTGGMMANALRGK